MKIVVNGIALGRASRGGRRYFDGVRQHLDWGDALAISQRPAWTKFERVAELITRGKKNSIYWSPTHRGPLAVHNHVITVLDCINVEYVYRNDWRLKFFRRLLNEVLVNARVIITISNATRDAVLRNYTVDESKIVVIPGPTKLFLKKQEPNALPLPNQATTRTQKKFILMVTNQLPHKNTRAAGYALAASKAASLGLSLRIVGGFDAAGLEACRQAGLTTQQFSWVEDSTLWRWISEAEFLFSPSLDEGLNFPVAEALALGANVLCSDISVHREFFDGEVTFCDPLRLDSMVAAINRVFEVGRCGPSGLELKRPTRPGFREVAAGYREVFESIVHDGPLPAGLARQ